MRTHLYLGTIKVCVFVLNRDVVDFYIDYSGKQQLIMKLFILIKQFMLLK